MKRCKLFKNAAVRKLSLLFSVFLSIVTLKCLNETDVSHLFDLFFSWTVWLAVVFFATIFNKQVVFAKYEIQTSHESPPINHPVVGFPIDSI